MMCSPPYYLEEHSCRKCLITLVANEPSNNNSAVGNCRVPSLSFNFTICILLREPQYNSFQCNFSDPISPIAMRYDAMIGHDV
jgi:hypothetical protein